ncbi:tetratricopeptide repeat protein [Candidatus Obscuribacterales bacterium]|nr:tetratricopeptide repeat protein [Candidatus Obscuribacterales bacterium]
MKLHSRALASIIIAAFLFTLEVPLAYSQSDSMVVELNNEGVRALSAQNFSLAISKLEESLKRDPSYGRARENLAIAYNNFGLGLAAKREFSEAIKYFHKAVYIDSNNSTSKQNLSLIVQNLGRSPNNFQDRVALGDEARKQIRTPQDWAGPIVEYQAALAIKDDPGVREKLGDVYRIIDKVDSAITEYNRAIALKDSEHLQVKLAQAFQAKKHLSEALNAINRAMAFNSKNPDALDALVAIWEDMLKNNPTSPENHLGLARALVSRGDFGGANAELQQAIRFSPGESNSEAQQLLSTLPRLQREDAIVRHMNNGRDLQKHGDLDGAMEEFKQALTCSPNEADGWASLASIYYAKRDFDNAFQAYKQALNFDPDHQEAKKGLQLAQAAITAAQMVMSSPNTKAESTSTTQVALVQQNGGPLVTRNVKQLTASNSTGQKLGRCHAILVATEKYSHQGYSKLSNPIRDARDIREILTKFYGWDVDILENRSKLDIMDTIIEAVNKNPEYDELFIYFAGHGDWDNNLHDGMIVTSDSRDKDRTRDSYITYSELKTLLERGACKKVLLALDVCFGGAFLDQIGRTRSSGTDIYQRSTLDDCIVRIKDRYTRKLVTPGEKEPVYEGLPGQHSPLARNLLRTLVQKGGDRGFVRFIDLEAATMDTKPMGRAAGFSDSDDPTSDFIFVPMRRN